jgi:hypothetical protein
MPEECPATEQVVGRALRAVRMRRRRGAFPNLRTVWTLAAGWLEYSKINAVRDPAQR